MPTRSFRPSAAGEHRTWPKRKWSHARAALGALLAVWIAAPSAQALTCGPLYNVRLPHAQDVDVPTNAWLWGYPRIDKLFDTRLMGPEGEVQLIEQQIQQLAGPVSVLIPEQPLLPHTEYQIERSYWDDDRRGGGQWLPESSPVFTTGEGPKQRPAPQPELISQTHSTGTFWDQEVASRSVLLEFQRSAILVAALGRQREGGIETVQDFAQARQMALTEPADLPAIASVAWVTQGKRLSVGVSDCLTWPNAATEQVDVSFGAYDIAGNFSGWTEPVAVSLSPDEGWSCSSAPSGPAEGRWWFALGGLALLGWTRRNLPLVAR